MNNKIKELRLSQGWSRRDLAIKSGMTENYVYMIEAGRCNPTVKKLEAIAKCFGLTVKDLL